MHSGFFASLISTFLMIHGMLYHPVFSKIPTLTAQDLSEAQITLSVPNSAEFHAPTVQADGAYVVDVGSGEELFAKNPDRELFPASTTKIMTALLALENYQLDAIASVSGNLAKDGSSMGLVRGERISVRNLMAGLLIPSANDSADELSRLYPGGAEAFVARMNTRAHELGLTNTHYTNPIGYEDPGHVTSVRDLAILARTAMLQPEFARLVRMPSLSVTSADGNLVHRLRSTDELLGKFPGIEGIKTGWTQEAGECFVAQATRGNQTIISVVLHSPDRFGETKSLLDWAFANFKTETKTLSEW